MSTREVGEDEVVELADVVVDVRAGHVSVRLSSESAGDVGPVQEGGEGVGERGDVTRSGLEAVVTVDDDVAEPADS